MTFTTLKNFIKDFSLPLFSGVMIEFFYLPSLRSVQIPSYLTIHSIFEVFSVTLCFMIFTFQWSIKEKQTKSDLRFLSCMFLSIGLYDLFHMLSYKGMPALVTPSGVEKAIYFWLAARAAQTVVFFMMAIRPHVETSIEKLYMKVGFSIAMFCAFSWAVLFHMDVLPRMFISGKGLTPLKVQLEYTFIVLSFISGVIFYRRKLKGVESDRNLFLANSAFMMVVAEFALTLYDQHDDLFNFYGHVLKAVAYVYIYRGILSRELIRPYDEIETLKNELQLGLKNFRALETEYTRAKKIASLGAEVGHIAHDLNNVLTVISVNAQSLARTHSNDEVTLKKVDVIKHAVMKSSEFLRSLINFSKNVETEKNVIDVAGSLKGIHSLLNPLLGKNIKLNIVSESGVSIWSTQTDVHQIVLNLVVNARDAIGQKTGTIDISAYRKVLSEDIATDLNQIPKGTYSVIKVSDSGSGISPENISKIFEPFFTTKGEGKGSGIGLATVRSIVSKNGGHIIVESELNKGTSFSIYLSCNYCVYVLPPEFEKQSA